MKKFITLLAILLIGMVSFAQSDYTHSLTTVGDASGTFWNYSDTTADGQTIDAIIRVRSDKVMDLRAQIVFNELTGAATATMTLLG